MASPYCKTVMGIFLLPTCKAIDVREGIYRAAETDTELSPSCACADIKLRKINIGMKIIYFNVRIFLKIILLLNYFIPGKGYFGGKAKITESAEFFFHLLHHILLYHLLGKINHVHKGFGT